MKSGYITYEFTSKNKSHDKIVIRIPDDFELRDVLVLRYFTKLLFKIKSKL